MHLKNEVAVDDVTAVETWCCVWHFLCDQGSEATLRELWKKTLSQCEQQYFVNFVAHIL
jgi:hypothetical protein